MKNKSFKRLLTALLLICSAVVYAHDFKANAICYNILSEKDKTVEVTNSSNPYEGAVTIPKSVNHNGTTY